MERKCGTCAMGVRSLLGLHQGNGAVMFVEVGWSCQALDVSTDVDRRAVSQAVVALQVGQRDLPSLGCLVLEDSSCECRVFDLLLLLHWD